MSRLVGLAVLPVVLAALLGAPAALADGDPASDYLISQTTFFPFSSKVDKSKQDGLVALLAASKKAGLDLRVAVIGAKSDLGSIPVLFGKPGQYSQFLGQEIVYWYKHDLLVVMPNGYGLYRNGKTPAADRAVIAKLPPPDTTNGNALVDSASKAVTALAASKGIDLSGVKASGSGSSTSRDRIEIGAGFLIALVLMAGLVFLRRRTARRG
jgi:hypothetical protein